MAEQTYTLGYNADKIQEILSRADENPVTLYHDEEASMYRGFSSVENRDLWISNPTRYANLEIFSFPSSEGASQYTAEIYLTSGTNVNFQYGEKDKYISFTFNVKNKQGYSSGDDVIVTYTFTGSGSGTKSVSEMYSNGTSVNFCVDDYLAVGTNRVVITLRGVRTSASTTQSVVYNVINLKLDAEFDFSKVYSQGESFSFNIKAEGERTKYIETYIDGVSVTGANDYISILSGTLVKVCTLSSSISSGKHNIQVRAYVEINSTKFYTKTQSFDFAVSGGTVPLVLFATTISQPGSVITLNANQYESTIFKSVLYDPSHGELDVSFSDKNGVFASRKMSNGNIESITYTPNSYGDDNIIASVNSKNYLLNISVTKSNVNMSVATSGLVLQLSAKGRTNGDTNKGTWTYGNYSTSFSSNFPFNERCGWVDNALVLSGGAYVSINLSPLAENIADTGLTLELDYEVDNGNSNDDAEIMNLQNTNGDGILVTPTYIRVKASDGRNIKHLRMTGVRKKIAIVINRNTIDANKGIFHTISNGDFGYSQNYTSARPFICSKNIVIGDTTGSCTVRLYSIRVYSRAISVEEELGNYAVDSGNVISIANRNDIFTDGQQRLSFDKTKIKVSSIRITGDIQKLLSVQDKTTSITATVEFYDSGDINKYWKATNVTIKNQGTSTLKFPIKNFSFNFGNSKFYNYIGTEVAMSGIKLHSNSAPVKKLVAKCDYMESSSSFNTSGAISFNDTGFNTPITSNGETAYPLRTNAQKYAVEHDITTDIRTAIDGVAVAMFYRMSEDGDDVCLGQYNLNNGKDDCPEAYGFKGMTGYDASNTERWELCEEGSLCCFTAASQSLFDTDYSTYFECVYPSTSQSPTRLKRLVNWLGSLDNGNGTYNITKFNSEYAQYLDPWKCAHYYIHIFIKNIGVDQVTKNMHLITEDGNIWFPVYYDGDSAKLNDNDGYQFDTVYNDGVAVNPLYANRESVDSKGNYVFQGHESVLWNCIEGSDTFMAIVKQVISAEYSHGFNYDNEVKTYITEHTGLFPQRIINQNAEAKYLDPYRNGTNYLYVSQGVKDERVRLIADRRLKRYEAMWAFGGYTSRSVNFRLNTGNTVSAGKIKVTAFSEYWFAYSSNLRMVESGVKLSANGSHSFTVGSHDNGDILRIHGTDQMAELDMSEIAGGLYSVETNNTYSSESATHLKKLVLGNASSENNTVTQINGLAKLTALEYLDITNFKGITSVDLPASMKTLLASGSSIAVFAPAEGSQYTSVSLPSTILDITLKDTSIGTLNYTINDNLENVSIQNMSSSDAMKTFVINWFNYLNNDEDTDWTSKTLTCTGIDWRNFSADTLISMKQKWGDNLVLKGKIGLSEITQEQFNSLSSLFEDCFSKTSKLYIYPEGSSLIWFAPSSIQEGSTGQIVLYTPEEGTVSYRNNGCEGVTIDNNGKITVAEIGNNRTLSATIIFWPESGGVVTQNISISIIALIYPTISSINGSAIISEDSNYSYTLDSSSSTGTYKSVEWSLSGEAVTGGYLQITNTTSDTCKVVVANNPPEDTSYTATLLLKLYKGNGTYSSKSLVITVMEQDVIVAYRDGDAFTECYDRMVFTSVGMTTSKNGQFTLTKAYNNMMVYFYSSTTNVITITPEQDCSLIFNTYCNTSRGFTLWLLSDLGNRSYAVNQTKKTLSIPLVKDVTYNIRVSSNDTGASVWLTDIVLGTYGNVVAPSGANINNPLLDIAFRREWLIKDGINLWKSDCKQVTDLTNVENFGKYSSLTTFDEFQYFTGIKSLNETGFNAALTSLKLPNSLTYLGTIINGCILNTLVIPDSVTDFTFNMGSGTINTLTLGNNITKFNILTGVIPTIGSVQTKEGGSLSYENGIVFDSGKTMVKSGTLATGDVVLPSTITSIQDNAFTKNTNINNIAFPSSLATIGSSAFLQSSITSADLESTQITVIPDSCFTSCSSLTTVKLPVGLKEIQNYAFSNDSALTSIVIPDTVTTLKGYCFTECTSLDSVTIGSGVTSYYSYVFWGCANIGTLIFKPSGTLSIDYTVFGSGTKTIGYNNRATGNNIFYVRTDNTYVENSTWWKAYVGSASYGGFTLSKTLTSE